VTRATWSNDDDSDKYALYFETHHEGPSDQSENAQALRQHSEQFFSGGSDDSPGQPPGDALLITKVIELGSWFVDRIRGAASSQPATPTLTEAVDQTAGQAEQSAAAMQEAVVAHLVSRLQPPTPDSGTQGSVTTDVGIVAAWKRAVGVRERVDLTDPDEAAALTSEDVGTRGHWRDLAEAAPERSVGAVVNQVADKLYQVVGEVGGKGIGTTFENNKALFHKQNETHQDMAEAIVDWAKYETKAIQTVPEGTAATRLTGLVINEHDRAQILWNTYLSTLPEDERASLNASPYHEAGKSEPKEYVEYKQRAGDWTATTI
jgi:hypothetical protein